ncbi:hypothetical protein K2173_011975 [Erythroxylum novogranatense]|uniref:beta-galactosidase n=1 Tax=Erythroxylum novogranatense TaxID=1862640 RepID=A0AAV8TG78_9ROSI|nr:hypothetical protein K2173_011975 [Erythroxylum novogranatense]
MGISNKDSAFAISKNLVLETYCVNGNKTAPSQYHFKGRYDLFKFVKIVQQVGMYLILRIGPYIAAEWNFGGLPVWLHYVPVTVFRADNYNLSWNFINLLRAEILDIHSEPDETREPVCFRGRSYHLGSGFIVLLCSEFIFCGNER